MGKNVSRVWILWSLAACGPSGDEPRERTQENAVTAGSAVCDLTPVDDEGTLPSCAAGTPGSQDKGKPFDDTGDASPLPVTAADAAATAVANALSTARNPAAQAPIDRGFGKAKP